MTVLRMAKFVDDDEVLRDVESAAFARDRWMATLTGLDFKGVRSVTEAFLAALFEGRDPAAVGELSFTDMSPDVEATLSRWVDGVAGAAAPTPVRREKMPAAPAPASPPPPPHGAPRFAAVEDPGEKYTPTRLVRRLRAQLTRYLEAAWPLNDTRLVHARRALFDEDRGGRLLAQEPFVETTPRYTAFEGTFTELPIAREEASFLASLAEDRDGAPPLVFPSLYAHQAAALGTFLGPARKNIVVATGTGSGKTECFMLPMVAKLHAEARERPEAWKKRGVRALVLYPMNALVNDQVARLRRLIGDEGFARQFREHTGAARHPVFGMYTGRTPYAGPRDAGKDGKAVAPLLRWYRDLEGREPAIAKHLREMGRYPAKDLDAFLAENLAEEATFASGKKKGGKHTKHHWKQRLSTSPGDRELLTRHEMIFDADTGQGAAPDVLVTNYSMLEYMLMRPFERPIFEETRRWLDEPGSTFLLVLDEAHMYRGAKGAEVAFLLRRLFDRLGLTDRPEKLSMIATSASLGSGPEALDVARRFAADLSGLAPERFEIITGRRMPARSPAPGTPETAAALASVDLEELHKARGGEELTRALAPLLAHLGAGPLAGDEAGALAALHAALVDRPFTQQVLHATSAQAVSLGALADRVFPGAEHSHKATEVLLTLGAIARTRPDAPGLLPARLHMLFRGLGGLYACINPHCEGRQCEPGEPAPVGKLFAEARTACDACGSRVFELASCRECGAAYCVAYAPSHDLSGWNFLWGEAAASDGVAVQLLPGAPRPGHDVELVRAQLRTGLLVGAGERHEARTVRDLYLAHADGKRSPEFATCPVCQPPGSQRKPRIWDHRTRGEQPFTALIETQFAEQPPQSQREDLPNRGRKVLVFSDGRQKAARLAPALAAGHAQDAFRQVLALAAQALGALGQPAAVHRLYQASLRVCADRSVDLFPDKGDESGQWSAHLQTAGSHTLAQLLDDSTLEAPLAFSRALFAELTERFLSLPQLGVGFVSLHPARAPGLLRSFPATVQLDAGRRLALVDSWLRALLERRCFLPDHASRARLGDERHRPEGITPGKHLELVPQRFRDALRRLFVDAGAHDAVLRWFESLGTAGLFRTHDNLLYLAPSSLVVRLSPEGPWWACAQCHRMHREPLDPQTPSCDDCGGALAHADESVLSARAGYYRDAVLRALSGSSVEPFGLTVAEHTAQLTGGGDDDAFSLTERYELRFQDLRIENEPPIDVLSCTTTMEVGIDIGALCGVALRNVPPHVSNYQQRAGRAGRRGRAIASVITYAQGGSHDAWYYEDPSRIVSGDVRSPVVYVQNEQVLRRHASAWLVQRFFHETVPRGSAAYALFEAMGTVRDFLDPKQPCSLARMEVWLTQNEARLWGELLRWVPSFCHGAGQRIDARTSLDGLFAGLLDGLRKELPVREAGALEALDDEARASVERRLDENLLQTLIERALLPRYAFPTDTVSFWVARPRGAGDKKYDQQFEYQPQRDLQIALSEYAPGRSLTIDGQRFTSAALYNPYQLDVSRTIARQVHYASCRACGYVGTGAQVRALAACPVCGDPALFKRPFVRPEGFAPDINARREPDRGGAVTAVGETTPAKLEVLTVEHWDESRFDGRLRISVADRDLVVVNKGLNNRGFVVCDRCGLAEPPYGPDFTNTRLTGKAAERAHTHPTKLGATCTGRGSEPLYLGHTFHTDVLLLRVRLGAPVFCPVADRAGRTGSPGRAALTSLVEAVALAASRTLQIDEGELAGNWNPVPSGDPYEADVYFYDLLPGGAGYTGQVRDNLAAVLDAARGILASCSCTASCYRCLRHWGNQRTHGMLDRRLALALLDAIVRGDVPSVDEATAEAALDSLRETLRLRGIAHREETVEGTDGAPVRVPLVVTAPSGGETWVVVHHPLVDVGAAPTAVMNAAVDRMMPVVAVDLWTVENALPLAVARIEGPA